jgi:oligoribonuclease (3'-5' exoribonuclease)
MGYSVASPFLSTIERGTLQLKPQKRLYNVEIEYQSGLTRNVQVKAVSKAKAEERALKFHPSAIRVKRSG